MKNLIKGRVSIVVPVYNTPPGFLAECFESIEHQDYDDKELIIVNDGSTSSDTNAFCEKYAAEHEEWCTLIVTENHGASCARGTGIAKASGSMLMFVDGDDRLEPAALSRLVQVMTQQEADAVIGEDYVREEIAHMVTYTGSNTLTALLENKAASFGWALWGKLFDTELMCSIYRPRSDIFYGEDLLVNAEYFANAGRTVLINEKVYFYRTDNPDSAMAQAQSVRKLTLIRMWRELADIYRAHGLNTEAEKIMANYYDSLLGGYLQCEYYKYDNYKSIMKDIKGELKTRLGDIMACPYVTGKYKYILAIHFLWIFRLRRKFKNKGKS